LIFSIFECLKTQSMKRLFLLSIAIIYLFVFNEATNAQTPQWLWAKNAVGTGDEMATSNAVDVSGNAYVAGYFRSTTLTFGSTILKNKDSTGYHYDVFLAKYDANGNIKWAKSAGGMDQDYSYSIAVDLYGNIYMAGCFEGPTIAFDSIILTNTNSSGSDDIFIVKYNSSGKLLWAKNPCGSGADYAISISADSTGKIYLAGFFRSSTLTFGSTILTNADTTGWTANIFLVKYDTSGNVLWAKSTKQMKGETRDAFTNSVAVESSGNAYLTGSFNNDTIIFGFDTLINSSQGGETFLAKYDTNGNILWIIGDTGQFNLSSVAVDSIGNAYTIGYFTSPKLIFNSDTLWNAGFRDVFLTKYDLNGNILWARSAGGTSYDYVSSIAVTASGNSYITGEFGSTNLVIDSIILSNSSGSGNLALYLIQFDNNGNVKWAKSASGLGCINSVAVDKLGNAYVTGYFWSSNISFDISTLINSGNFDIFLTKSDSGVLTGTPEFYSSLKISIYPNPASDNLTIESPQKSEIEIVNLQGQLTKSFTAISNKTTIDVSGFAKGIYFVKVKTKNGVAVKKFVKE